ncbi:MAG: flagellar hook-basal body complex protein FliE [Treponema sp.]|jgi:flagellar hook-basal body complex protein FliE|nr:flagellar hook-basal body complex protein FliE [Treponema sp.]
MSVDSVNAVGGGNVIMAVSDPRHMTSDAVDFTRIGHTVNDLAKVTGADSVTRSGTFEKAMLQALDQVSGYQQFASSLEQQAITDPGSVDPHDITIAQYMARLSLDMTRNVLNRIVQGWRDLINTR